jgi:hypothetical protein
MLQRDQAVADTLGDEIDDHDGGDYDNDKRHTIMMMRMMTMMTLMSNKVIQAMDN